MAPNPKVTEEKINALTEGWEEIAKNATFYGLTLAQFKTKMKDSMDAREKIDQLERQLAVARVESDNADPASLETIANVVNSVKGDQNYGEDSALYASFGYVRKSERKSGLTRGSQTAPIPLVKVAA